MNNIKQIILSILLFFSLFTLKLETTCASMPKKVVEVETIHPQTIREIIRLIGIVQAKHQVTLTARLDGILDQIVPSGTFVRKGDVIARLSNKPSRRVYESARQSELLEAEKYARAKDLYHKKIISKAAFEAAHKHLLDAKKTTSLAEKELEGSEYTAPFDGLVGVYKVREGSQVSVGDEIVTLYDPSRLIVTFDVPEAILPRLRKDQRLFVEGKGTSLSSFQKFIDPETHMAPAEAELKEGPYVPGGNVDVDIILEEKQNALAIPFEAYFLRDGKAHVYKVVEKKTKLTAIRIGIQEKNRLEVVEGLKEGDQIVSVNPTRLYPELDIDIASGKTESKEKSA